MKPYPIALAAALCAAAPAQAQHRQEVKPPQAQAWIDVATFSGLGLPMGAGANPMAALGGLFGRGQAAQVSFGMTQAGGAGRFVDVTVSSRLQPALAEATQDVPAGFMSPALKLIAPREAPAAPVRERDDEVVPERDPQRPQGKVYLYWGCGDAVRPGQPRVVDFASASMQDLAQIFQSRRATQRGTHSATGRPHWPNATDGRAVPAGASLVGTHQFSAAGLPEGFRFALAAAQDLMPPLQLQQQGEPGQAVALSWAAQPHARAFFVAGMGARGNNEMVIWTSSELPDAGMGLIDYQTNAAVDGWLREKVLLSPQTTRCTVPKGVFTGEGAMLRAIAYGNELNLAHPPRPADPKVPWEPVWAVKVRVKSVATAMLGMPAMEAPEREAGQAQGSEPAPAHQPAEEPKKKPSALDILKGVLGR